MAMQGNSERDYGHRRAAGVLRGMKGRALMIVVGITVMALFLISVASASVFYKYDVIGKTGQAGITDIVGDNPSINDNGMVAFVGVLR